MAEGNFCVSRSLSLTSVRNLAAEPENKANVSEEKIAKEEDKPEKEESADASDNAEGDPQENAEGEPGGEPVASGG